MESVWLVSKLLTESVGSRRKLVPNSVQDRRRRRDSTRQSRVGGVLVFALVEISRKLGPIYISSAALYQMSLLNYHVKTAVVKIFHQWKFFKAYLHTKFGNPT